MSALCKLAINREASNPCILLAFRLMARQASPIIVLASLQLGLNNPTTTTTARIKTTPHTQTHWRK